MAIPHLHGLTVEAKRNLVETKRSLSVETKRSLSAETKTSLYQEIHSIERELDEIEFSDNNVVDIWKTLNDFWIKMKSLIMKITKEFEDSLNATENTSISYQFSYLNYNFKDPNRIRNAKIYSSTITKSKILIRTLKKLEILSGITVDTITSINESKYMNYCLHINKDHYINVTFKDLEPPESKLLQKLDDSEIQADIDKLKDSKNIIEEGDDDWIMQLGIKLSKSIFDTNLKDHFTRAKRISKNKITIDLKIDDPSIFNVPWEAMYFEPEERYLSLDQSTPMRRLIPTTNYRNESTRFGSTVKVLLIGANPVDQSIPGVNIQRELENLEDALGKAKLNSKLDIRVHPVRVGSAARILEELGNDNYDIVHFIGHGIFNTETEEGSLALENEKDGGLNAANHKRVAEIFQDHKSIKLFVLNACQGGETSTYYAFQGVGAWLAFQGIPAVIAMRYSITYDLAYYFTQTFYSNLGFKSIEENLQFSRKCIRSSDKDVRDFLSPVLFVAVPE